MRFTSFAAPTFLCLILGATYPPTVEATSLELTQESAAMQEAQYEELAQAEMFGSKHRALTKAAVEILW